MGGARDPNPNPAGSWELPKSEEKNGGVVGWYEIISAKHITTKYVF